MSIAAYPLQWPVGWKRTSGLRREAKFGKRTSSARTVDLTISQATQRVLAELQRMGIRRDDAVISTNLVLNLNGLPRSAQARPTDPGAAVYCQDAGARRVMAIDQYATVEDNLAAIAATLDAMRAIERHGGAVILERAFTGFTALPAPTPEVARHWTDVLDCSLNSTPGYILAAFRQLRSRYHPDKQDTGDAAKFDAVQKAYEQAVAEGKA